MKNSLRVSQGTDLNSRSGSDLTADSEHGLRSQAIARAFRRGLLVLAGTTALNSTLPEKGQASPEIASEPVSTSDTPPFSAEELLRDFGVVVDSLSRSSLNTLASRKIGWPSLMHTFGSRDEDGNVTSSLHKGLSLLCPVALVWNVRLGETDSLQVRLPYTYSRLFDTAQALRPEDLNRVSAAIDSQVREQLSNQLRGLGFTKSAYLAQHPDYDRRADGQLTSLRTVGEASPEGPAKYGAESIPGISDDGSPGFQEEFSENTGLAYRRAVNLDTAVRRKLKELGVSGVDSIPQSLEGRQGQFTPAQIERLLHLSASFPGKTPRAQVFSLVQAYNDGAIADPAVNAELAGILYGGRAATSYAEVDGRSESKTIIPLPLALVPFLFLRRRRNGQTPPPVNPPAAQPVPGPSGSEGGGQAGTASGERTPDSAAHGKTDQGRDVRTAGVEQGNSHAASLEGETIPLAAPIIRNTEMPARGSEPYRQMYREVLVNDISFDPSAERYNYVQLAATLKPRLQGMDSSEQELVYTAAILEMWRRGDLSALMESGVPIENYPDLLKDKLAYDRKPGQIRWARMHAIVLMEAVEEQQRHGASGRMRDLEDVLRSKALEWIRTEDEQGRI